MGNDYSRYTDAFRAEIVELVTSGQKSRRAIEREYGIARDTVGLWAAIAQGRGAGPPLAAPPLTAPLAREQTRPIHTPAPPEVKGGTVLAIPDLHCPFEHPDALAFLTAVKQRFKPDTVVCLGDEIDAHAFSRYPMDPDGLSAGQELRAAIEHLQAFYRLFPEVLVCESNHTVRPWKKMFEAGLPASFLPTYSAILQAPDGWHWKGHWDIDGVRYMHGDAGKSGQYAHVNYMKALKASVVIGHIHSYAGVNYEGGHFGMNAGCLIDESAYCFKYAKNMPTRVNLGCGLILKGKQAFFIPMLLDDNQRWIGRLYA
jgi:transposase-like protein